MRKWNLIKDDPSHWHYEQRTTPKLVEALKSYDLQLTFVLNPLNWDVGRFNDYAGVTDLSFGPFKLMIYYG